MRSKYEAEEPVPRSKCITCLCVSWKVFSCIFSHVTLIAVVVAYCVFGAFLFERLESEHEEKVSIYLLEKMGNEMSFDRKIKYLLVLSEFSRKFNNLCIII